MECRAGDVPLKAQAAAGGETAHNAPAGSVSALMAAAADTDSTQINSALLHRMLRIGFPFRQ